MNPILVRAALVAAAFTVASAQVVAQPVSIAAAPSLTADMSKGQAKFVDDEFPAMFREFTGLDARLSKRDSLATVGRNLTAGTDQFAILQGAEYGWLKAKHPEIQPLLIAIYHNVRPRALLLAKKDDPAKSFADLKGKSVGILKAGKAPHVYSVRPEAKRGSDLRQVLRQGRLELQSGDPARRHPARENDRRRRRPGVARQLPRSQPRPIRTSPGRRGVAAFPADGDLLRTE